MAVYLGFNQENVLGVKLKFIICMNSSANLQSKIHVEIQTSQRLPNILLLCNTCYNQSCLLREKTNPATLNPFKELIMLARDR